MAFSIWKHGSFKNAVVLSEVAVPSFWLTSLIMSWGYLFYGVVHPLPLTPADVDKAANRASSPVAAQCIRQSVINAVRSLETPLRKRQIHKISQMCEFAAELKQNPPAEGTRDALMAQCLFTDHSISQYQEFIHGSPRLRDSWRKQTEFTDADPVVLYSVFSPVEKMKYCPRQVDEKLASLRFIEQSKAKVATRTPAP